jgi:peptidyl-prolyl cis-trans isomerase SDCCAG10
MSNYYSQEPPTSGKVILITNYGNIDIELWTKETPKTCKNFIQLCLENYYNNNIFFRIINKFMIQTGDKTNSGKSGSSIYNNLEFKDEIHSRLKFNHRGMVAMANKNIKNSNLSQFFITMDKCPWLNNKHTIFGKVIGDTFFNAQNINELLTDKNDYPIVDPLPMIIKTEVVINPFNDIIPREINYNANNNENNENNNNENNKMKENNEKNENKNLNKDYLSNNLLSIDENENFNNEININLKKKSKNYKEDDNNNNNIEINKIINENENKKEENNNSIKKENSVSESESVSLSENDERVKKAKNKINEEYNNNNLKENEKQLKNDIKLLQKKFTRNENTSIISEESNINEKKITPLEKYNLKYKSKKLNAKDKEEILKNFTNKISKAKNLRIKNWLNIKLKFQIDSQRAYDLNNINKEEEHK